MIDLVLLVDGHAKVLEVLAQDARIGAFTQEEARGRRLDALLPAALAQALAETLAETLAQRAAGRRKLALREGGRERWLELTVTPSSRSQDEAQASCVVICSDITDSRLAEQHLRTSEQRYRLLAEHASDVIWTMSLDGRITSLSAAVQKVRGFTVEEAMQQTLDQILAPASQGEVIRYFEALHAAIAQGSPVPTYRGEQQYLCRDGSTFWADVIACPVTDEQGRVLEILGVSRDISRQVAQQQHLERLVQARTGELSLAKEAAESANRAKSELLANVGHELRTPLHAIVGFTDLALGAATDAAQREDLRRVAQATQRLRELIEAMIETARLEAGRVTLDRAALTPGAVVSAVTQLMEPLARDKGLRLELAIAPEAARTRLMGDERRLSLVLVNLLSNAIKFTPSGTVTLRCAVAARAHDRCRVRFEVTDTGIGIAPQDRERIFRVFEQADASVSRRQGGAGLGLPISRRIAEAMGGSLTVASQPGQGSTFTLEVSLEPADGASAQSVGATLPTPPIEPPAPETAVAAAAQALTPGLAPEILDWLRELTARLEAGDPAVRQWMEQAPPALPRDMPEVMQRLRRCVAAFDFDAGLDLARALQARLGAHDMQD